MKKAKYCTLILFAILTLCVPISVADWGPWSNTYEAEAPETPSPPSEPLNIYDVMATFVFALILISAIIGFIAMALNYIQ